VLVDTNTSLPLLFIPSFFPPQQLEWTAPRIQPVSLPFYFSQPTLPKSKAKEEEGAKKACTAISFARKS
jgi:hypothetical protein